MRIDRYIDREGMRERGWREKERESNIDENVTTCYRCIFVIAVIGYIAHSR